MFCVVFHKGWWGGGPHGALIVPGWVPVAWGRGCLVIRNSDNPLPEGKKGGWKRNRSRPPPPRGRVGFLFVSLHVVRPPIPLSTLARWVGTACQLGSSLLQAPDGYGTPVEGLAAGVPWRGVATSA